jgi:hypothetical protein
MNRPVSHAGIRWRLITLAVICLVFTGATRLYSQHQVLHGQVDAGGTKRSSISFISRDAAGTSYSSSRIQGEKYTNKTGLFRAAYLDMAGDIDGNGLLNENDLFYFSSSWGSRAGEESFLYKANLIQDSTISTITQEDLMQWIILHRKGSVTR